MDVALQIIGLTIATIGTAVAYIIVGIACADSADMLDGAKWHLKENAAIFLWPLLLLFGMLVTVGKLFGRVIRFGLE